MSGFDNDLDNEPADVYEFEDGSAYVSFGEDEGDEDVDLEIVDDTPEEDRGREPLGYDPEFDESETAQYSKGVQKRINELTRAKNDERRAKEEYARQQAEALAFAQRALEENKRLKETLAWGEKTLIQQAREKLAIDTIVAEARYKQAYDEGNPEGVLEAQKQWLKVQQEAERLNSYQPVANNLQNQAVPVYTAPQPVQQPVRDEKAEAWAARNSWYGVDEELTSFALGVHEKLVKQGVDPTSDDYYRSLDRRLREVFPQQFKSSRNAAVVAPATRTSPAKKVVLTTSQVAIAKRLGVSLEAYAKQVANSPLN